MGMTWEDGLAEIDAFYEVDESANLGQGGAGGVQTGAAAFGEEVGDTATRKQVEGQLCRDSEDLGQADELSARSRPAAEAVVEEQTAAIETGEHSTGATDPKAPEDRALRVGIDDSMHEDEDDANAAVPMNELVADHMHLDHVTHLLSPGNSPAEHLDQPHFIEQSATDTGERRDTIAEPIIPSTSARTRKNSMNISFVLNNATEEDRLSTTPTAAAKDIETAATTRKDSAAEPEVTASLPPTHAAPSPPTFTATSDNVQDSGQQQSLKIASPVSQPVGDSPLAAPSTEGQLTEVAATARDSDTNFLQRLKLAPTFASTAETTPSQTQQTEPSLTRRHEGSAQQELAGSTTVDEDAVAKSGDQHPAHVQSGTGEQQTVDDGLQFSSAFYSAHSSLPDRPPPATSFRSPDKLVAPEANMTPGQRQTEASQPSSEGKSSLIGEMRKEDVTACPRLVKRDDDIATDDGSAFADALSSPQPFKERLEKGMMEDMVAGDADSLIDADGESIAADEVAQIKDSASAAGRTVTSITILVPSKPAPKNKKPAPGHCPQTRLRSGKTTQAGPPPPVSEPALATKPSSPPSQLQAPAPAASAEIGSEDELASSSPRTFGRKKRKANVLLQQQNPDAGEKDGSRAKKAAKTLAAPSDAAAGEAAGGKGRKRKSTSKAEMSAAKRPKKRKKGKEVVKVSNRAVDTQPQMLRELSGVTYSADWPGGQGVGGRGKRRRKG